VEEKEKKQEYLQKIEQRLQKLEEIISQKKQENEK
jgi:hypothetical protein